MPKILVTGAAGTLGRLVAAELSAAGATVRGMSRRATPGDAWAGAEWLPADLETGAGLAQAVAGSEVVVHAATGGNRHTWQTDVEGTRRLLEAARQAGVAHVVFISIVGVDRVPYLVGKAKLAAEALIEQGGLPWSILRATQFHSALDGLLRFMTKLPLVALLPADLLLQPVAGEEVAQRLAEIARSSPAGRLPDMGGPRVYSTGELARLWLKQRGLRRAILPLWLPGATASAMRAGGNTCPQQATGQISWEGWLQQRYGQPARSPAVAR
jgi:uncharacterized protein YbjT (DUF2867 family)